MSIIKKNPGKLKKLLQSIPIPGWLFSLVTVVYCEVLLHLWTMNDFSLGRFAAVVLFALGFGGLLGQIAGFIGHRTWGKWVTAALAAVVSMNPDILVLDEPTNGLDEDSCDIVVNFLLAYVAAGKTVLMSTHHQDLVRRLGARAIYIDRYHHVVETPSPSYGTESGTTD